MIAKIGKGENILGALSYNQHKVDKENGKVLLTHKIPDTLDNRYSVATICRYFEPYLLANNKTEKPVRHISLNPDPEDKVTDDKFRDMASQYMKEMGYGNQPYIVYKHTDIERTHIHIVTTCVELDGKKIPDSYDHPRSMAICRKLEEQYGLKPALETKESQNERLFKPVEYARGNVKANIASVIRHLPKYYSYQSLGAYNALLSLFNITAEEVKGELGGQPRHGLVYFVLNENGEKASHPFKASLFGKNAGLAQLQSHFEHSKERMNGSKVRPILKNTIEIAMHSAGNEAAFKQQLNEQGINVVIRRNAEGRIYGMTFIDHESRSVWNGSQLSKNLSANMFNDWWKMEQKNTSASLSQEETKAPLHEPEQQPHHLFDFANTDNRNDEANNEFSSLLPESQGEDYEELAFENRMKKRKRKPGSNRA
jgi:hypothetical protein